MLNLIIWMLLFSFKDITVGPFDILLFILKKRAQILMNVFGPGNIGPFGTLKVYMVI